MRRGMQRRRGSAEVCRGGGVLKMRREEEMFWRGKEGRRIKIGYEEEEWLWKVGKVLERRRGKKRRKSYGDEKGFWRGGGVMEI